MNWLDLVFQCAGYVWVFHFTGWYGLQIDKVVLVCQWTSWFWDIFVGCMAVDISAVVKALKWTVGLSVVRWTFVIWDASVNWVVYYASTDWMFFFLWLFFFLEWGGVQWTSQHGCFKGLCGIQ